MSKSNHSDKQPVDIAVLEACVIGLAAAFGAVALKHGVGMIGSMRVHLAGDWPFWLPIVGLIGGAASGALVQYVVPQATGSGIPQTKAALHGVPIMLNLRTAFVKLVSCIMALGSGLALGREGPTVQVAASLAAKFSGWLRTSPTHRNQLIAAGAGAGLAAAFNAPLAGVMFVLEELLQNMSGISVGTTVVACFVAAVTSRLVGVHSLDINLSELFPKATFTFVDIPFVILLGILAGGLGSLFNKSIIAGLTFNREFVKLPLTVTCAMGGMMSGLIVMALPLIFRNYAGLREMLVQGQSEISVVLLALAVQFVLTVIAYGCGAPGGLFAPSLTLGVCLGHLVALAEQQLIHTGDVSTMSIVGMGAVFCAVARVPMTAVVIIFEMTTDFNVVLPLMICCVIAYLVSERLDPGSLYDQLLRWSGINLEEKETEHGILSKLTASRFMTRDVLTVSETMTLEEAKKFFLDKTHRGYPVIDSQEKVTGILSKLDLDEADRRKTKPDAPVSRFMTPKPITVRPGESLTGVLYLMSKYHVSRLPVVEQGRLAGIITRKDVVRAETEAMGMRTTSNTHSYVVYQTRSAESGLGRMLVAVGDPQTAASLITLAAAVAKRRSYELECLHVITVPKDKDPSETQVSSELGRKIAETAEGIGKKFGIPVHTNIRVAHNVDAAITETILDRNIDLFLMRWTGSKRAQKSDVLLQTVLQKTNCPALLVSRLPEKEEGLRFVVPVADFLEHDLALEMTDHLVTTAPGATMAMCHVKDNRTPATDSNINGNFDKLFQLWSLKREAETTKLEIEASSPVTLLNSMRQTAQCDVLVFGLPRKYLLKAMTKGAFKKTLNKVSEFAIVIAAE